MQLNPFQEKVQSLISDNKKKMVFYEKKFLNIDKKFSKVDNQKANMNATL